MSGFDRYHRPYQLVGEAMCALEEVAWDQHSAEAPEMLRAIGDAVTLLGEAIIAIQERDLPATFEGKVEQAVDEINRATAKLEDGR